MRITSIIGVSFVGLWLTVGQNLGEDKTVLTDRLLANIVTQPSAIPKEGFVPNAEVAAKIAEAVWVPIFGARSVALKKPFLVTQTNGIWLIRGTLPAGSLGGVPYAWIAKTNGAILKIWHDK